MATTGIAASISRVMWVDFPADETYKEVKTGEHA
jgi:hypothetical protein